MCEGSSSPGAKAFPLPPFPLVLVAGGARRCHVSLCRDQAAGLAAAAALSLGFGSSCTLVLCFRVLLDRDDAAGGFLGWRNRVPRFICCVFMLWVAVGSGAESCLGYLALLCAASSSPDQRSPKCAWKPALFTPAQSPPSQRRTTPAPKPREGPVSFWRCRSPCWGLADRARCFRSLQWCSLCFEIGDVCLEKHVVISQGKVPPSGCWRLLGTWGITESQTDLG